VARSGPLARSAILADTRIAALFLVSLCAIALVIEIMRVFAVASWSNFGAMVISIALLGFALAGTALTLAGDRVRRNPDSWMIGSAVALAPSVAAAHTLAQRVPFNPVLIASDPAQLWWVGLYYALYAVPFFCAGLFIGTVFTVFSSRMHALYFWNMLGSGLGGLLILGLMFLFPPGFLIYPLVGIAALPALLCSFRWMPGHTWYRARYLLAAACVLFAGGSIFLVARYGQIRVSDFKAESYAWQYPDVSLVHDSFSPLGDVHVFSSSYFHFAPGLSDNAAVALRTMPRDAFLGMFVDGNGPTGVMRALSAAEESYLEYLPMAAPYSLLSQPRVLILKLGSGAGVHTALHYGARSISVVESNGDLLRMLRDDTGLRQYTGDFLSDPRVKVVNTEVRAFAQSTQQRFDLVEISLADSIGLSQAGGYTMDENYMYTVEAIRDYVRCLASGGILSITVWDRLSPPRNVPKLLASVLQGMQEAGVAAPGRSLYAFNLLLSTATVMVKNGPFSPGEIAKLNSFSRRMSFDVDYFPGIAPMGTRMDALLRGYQDAYGSGAGAAPSSSAAAPASPSPASPSASQTATATSTQGPDLAPSQLYHGVVEWILGGKQDALFSSYVFDIRPATDDRPYYSGYLKPLSVPRLLGRAGEFPEEWGYLLLLATFIQSLIFGALVILLPLAGLRRGRGERDVPGGSRRGIGGVLVYFGCLGLGYMLAEIYLIQRFVYYLADPVYANSIVLTILLVSSGLGSLLKARLAMRPRPAVAVAVLGIAGFCAFFMFGLGSVLSATLGLPLVVRALVAAVIIAPFGMFLGIPFPTGLAAVAESGGSLLPWAWGLNGALSVTGAVLARLVSTSAGFTAVNVVVAALYVVACVMFWLRLGASPRAAIQEKTAAPARSVLHSS
jgi:hypothetical protein